MMICSPSEITIHHLLGRSVLAGTLSFLQLTWDPPSNPLCDITIHPLRCPSVLTGTLSFLQLCGTTPNTLSFLQLLMWDCPQIHRETSQFTPFGAQRPRWHSFLPPINVGPPPALFPSSHGSPPRVYPLSGNSEKADISSCV